eukprot:SAG11_NODE_5503_length_1543_cov_1.211219_2_plen_124_part_00
MEGSGRRATGAAALQAKLALDVQHMPLLTCPATWCSGAEGGDDRAASCAQWLATQWLATEVQVLVPGYTSFAEAWSGLIVQPDSGIVGHTYRQLSERSWLPWPACVWRQQSIDTQNLLDTACY